VNGYGDCDGNPTNGCELAAGSASDRVLFCDGFENGLGNWSTGTYWSRYSCFSCSGSYALSGTAGNTASSCDVTGDASMVLGVSLVGLTSASLYFMSAANPYGSLDVMTVYVSTNGGTSWSSLASAPTSSNWSNVAVNLAAYVGQPSVRLRFEFTNHCGDCCGVDWFIDNVFIEGR
jgi:hypothetical protein